MARSADLKKNLFNIEVLTASEQLQSMYYQIPICRDPASNPVGKAVLSDHIDKELSK